MEILTGWKSDGSLIIQCGGVTREIPEAQLASQIKANQEKRKGPTFSGGGPVFQFTRGNPAVVVEGIKPFMDKNYTIINSIAEIEEAIAGWTKGSSNELLFAWNSGEEIPIGDVRAVVDAQKASKLVVQLHPMFPIGWKA